MNVAPTNLGSQMLHSLFGGKICHDWQIPVVAPGTSWQSTHGLRNQMLSMHPYATYSAIILMSTNCHRIPCNIRFLGMNATAAELLPAAR